MLPSGDRLRAAQPDSSSPTIRGATGSRRRLDRVRLGALDPSVPSWRVGPFYQGMLDWVDGVRSIDEVFADIDAEWAALRAQGESPPPDS